MGWFEQLKSLIKGKLSLKGLKINIVNVNVTKNFTGCTIIQKGKYQYDESTKTLEVHPDEFIKHKGILSGYVNDGNRLLESETSELLKRLYEYKAGNTNQQTLHFFSDLIPRNDYSALSAALFLKNEFSHGKDVRKLKQDIRFQYGERGSCISNLCTAGYFEEFLMPAYNALTREEFLELYSLVVDHEALTIFVHQGMAIEEISEIIKNRLSIAKTYGLTFFHIHGIGKSNIEKIKECLKSQKDFFNFYEKKYLEKENILVIQLLLK